ncbi:hypothetical protein BDF19DRAFT_447830 [Syncephalis fuscata]|nr:hypothetical protein BDF19DRAFT_447830 [Syncephalis fuscata]
MRQGLFLLSVLILLLIGVTCAQDNEERCGINNKCGKEARCCNDGKCGRPHSCNTGCDPEGSFDPKDCLL